MNINVKEIMRKERWNDKHAKAYERYMKFFHRKERRFWKEAIGRTKATKALDVGAGSGFLSQIALELGCEVYALDISESMLRIASEKLKNYKSFKPIIGDAERLPFEEEEFDLVMSRFVLWTLPNPQEMIRECVRVLKRGGYILLADGESGDVNSFDKFVTTLIDLVIGWRLPTWKRVYKKFDPYLPRWGQNRVIEELRNLNIDIIAVIDLLAFQGFLYKALLSHSWHPYCIIGVKKD